MIATDQINQNATMALLPYQSIKDEITKNGLIINSINENVKPCSYDLRIGTIFRNGTMIRDENVQVILSPGQIISLFTEEEVNLPSDIAATVYPMNAQSSRGLLVLNPGHVDPGFKGPLTVKLLNMRRTEMVIQRKMEILTIVFERLEERTDLPYKENKSRGPRELAFNASDVEISPQTLGDLVTLARNTPFPSRSEVKEMIHDALHVRRLFFISVVAAIAAVAGALLSGAQLVDTKGESLQTRKAEQSLSSNQKATEKTPLQEKNPASN